MSGTMKNELKQQWYRIGDTNIYTTGHYVVEKSAVKKIFECELFDNGENISKVEKNEMITTRLKSDRRVLFYFFPLSKIHGKYIMEGNISDVVLAEIGEILPDPVKDILFSKRPVKYK